MVWARVREDGVDWGQKEAIAIGGLDGDGH